MAEERRISPALIIGGVAAAAITGTLIYLATRALAAPPLAGVIVDIKWRRSGTDGWHPFPMSVPEYTPTDIKWRVRNDNNFLATFTTGIIDLGKYRLYPETLTTLEPGEEADLIRENFPGFSEGTSGERTFYLAALAGEVISTYQPDWYDADLTDMVTIEYTYY